MFCKQMHPDEALLFVFPRPSVRHFWMKNTPVELAIIFVDRHKHVVAVKHGLPFDLQQLSSEKPVLFVVETLWSAGKHIRIGDKVGIR